MSLPASQRNFSSDCLRISPHRTASSRIPLRQAARNQPLSFSAPRCLVPNPVPHDLLLRPASSLVMLVLVLRFLQFASFRWPESNSAVFRNACCIMLAKTLRPLNIWYVRVCVHIIYGQMGVRKPPPASFLVGRERLAAGLCGGMGVVCGMEVKSATTFSWASRVPCCTLRA